MRRSARRNGAVNSRFLRLPEVALLLELAPAARTIVGDDPAEEGQERGAIDRLIAGQRDRPRRLVVVTRGDESVRVRNDAAVVYEHVHVVLRREQGADVPVEEEVRPNRPLDRLDDLLVGGVNDLTDLAADLLLPLRERVDVGVDPRVPGVAHAETLARAIRQATRRP